MLVMSDVKKTDANTDMKCCHILLKMLSLHLSANSVNFLPGDGSKCFVCSLLYHFVCGCGVNEWLRRRSHKYKFFFQAY